MTEYTVPGIYRLSAGAELDYLAVNATRGESDFAKLPQPDLLKRWQPMSVVLQEESALGEQTDGAALPAAARWPESCCCCLVAVLMVENVCANRL